MGGGLEAGVALLLASASVMLMTNAGDDALEDTEAMTSLNSCEVGREVVELGRKGDRR